MMGPQNNNGEHISNVIHVACDCGAHFYQFEHGGRSYEHPKGIYIYPPGPIPPCPNCGNEDLDEEAP